MVYESYIPTFGLNLWSKYMANPSPKGRLVHGMYNPIHGACLCHLPFFPGVLEM